MIAAPPKRTLLSKARFSDASMFLLVGEAL